MNTRSLKYYILFAEAWVWLAIARITLLLFSFQKLHPLLGTKGADVVPAQGGKYKATAMAISLSITRACRFSFWRTMCLEQSIAAKMMLRTRRIRSTIYFGVEMNNEESKMNAHAWLASEGQIVTGEKGMELFTIVASFTN